MEYDFSTLSPQDFELLARDLLQKELNLRLESFKSGKDNGVDLRYFGDSENSIIVQCKHYKNSTFSNLTTSLKKEIEKVKRLAPSRYIVVTSLPFSPENKNTILSICSPYIKSPSDIYGLEDLNNLIKQYKDVELNHFKLWMTNTNVLEHLLYSGEFNKSAFKLEEIKEKIKKFVPNPSLDIAKSILDKENFVVISGAPGVGKTTLADMLIWKYVIDGYQFINISEDIEEAYNLYKSDQDLKQVFYYDDFLGETNLSKNEDSRLISFIKQICRSKNKKMILTTREYILQQTKLLSEKIDNFDFKKCIVDLKRYTNRIKAEILYSHLYFSELPQDYINEILKEERYFGIIKHKNYNPRIIEHMTKIKRIEHISAKDYYNFFIKNLNDPSKIWNHAFENQLDNKTRSVLFAIVSINSHHLFFNKEIFFSTAQKICDKLYFEKLTKLDYTKALKILDGDFIKTNNSIPYFANPSIRDFLEIYIYKNGLLPIFIQVLDNKKQVQWIYNTYSSIFAKNRKIAVMLLDKLDYLYGIHKDIEITELKIDVIVATRDAELIERLKENLDYILEYDNEPYENDYLFKKLRSSIFDDNPMVLNFIKSIFNEISSRSFISRELDDTLNIAKFIDINSDILDESEVRDVINDIDNDFEELEESATYEYAEDLGDLEEARDKLEEINEKLNLFNDLICINTRIEELEEEEKMFNDTESTIFKYGDSISYQELSSDNEDSNIKDLFYSLEE